MSGDRALPGVHGAKGPNGEKVDKAGSGCGLGCLFILGAAIIISVVVWLFSLASGGSESSDDSSRNQYEAIAQCEARIEEQLRSPATAEFSTSASGAGANWTVSGTVDSENGFGALVRSEFQCTVEIGDGIATTSIDFLE